MPKQMSGLKPLLWHAALALLCTVLSGCQKEYVEAPPKRAAADSTDSNESVTAKLKDYLRERLRVLMHEQCWPTGLDIRNAAVTVKPWPKATSLDFSMPGVRLRLPPTTNRLAVNETLSIWADLPKPCVVLSYQRDGKRIPIMAARAGKVGDVKDCLEMLCKSLKNGLPDKKTRAILDKAFKSLQQTSDEKLFRQVMVAKARKVLSDNHSNVESLLIALAASEHQMLFRKSGIVCFEFDTCKAYVMQADVHDHYVVTYDARGQLLLTFIAESDPMDLRDVLRSAATARSWVALVPTENSIRGRK